MAFRRAVKTQAKARFALIGPSGSGKTYTALELATVLAEGGPIAYVDTEHGSASKYADLFSFDVLELDSFHPRQYIEAIREAEAGGYRAIVLDSLTHAWNGKGGILEIVERHGNGPQAWAGVKPIENALIETMLTAKLHVIATIRAKQTIAVEQDDRGKTQIKKLGLQAEQRGDIEYEFDFVGRLDIDNTMTIDKARYKRLKGQVIPMPGAEVGKVLLEWLNAGAPAPDDPDPTPTPPMPIRPAAPARPATQPAPARPAVAPSAPTGNAPATLQDFLAAALAIGFAPRQIMAALGVRSLSGLNYAAALERLASAGEPTAAPDDDLDASGEAYYPAPAEPEAEADNGPVITFEVVDTSTEPAPASSPAAEPEPKPIPLDWARLRQMTARAPLRHKSEYEFRRWAGGILGRDLPNIKALTLLSADEYATLEAKVTELVAAQERAEADHDLHVLTPGSRAS